MRFSTLTAQSACVGILLIVATAIGSQAYSATIERYEDPIMGCNILVSGQIETGDASRLQRLIDASYGSSSPSSFGQRVCFDSPGGNMLEGLAIADVISRTERGLGTAVAAGHVCESACALAFMAGWFTPDFRLILTDRVVHPTAKLGFHAPNLDIPTGNYSEREVQRSFTIALEVLAEISRRRNDTRYIIAESLITELLVTPYSEMRHIETVADASRWQVAVGPVDLFNESVPVAIANTCVAVAKGLLDHPHPSHFSVDDISEEVSITTVSASSLSAKTHRGFDLQNQSGLPCHVTFPAEMFHQGGVKALPVGDAAFNSGGQWEENWTGWGVVWPYQSFPGETRIVDLPFGSTSRTENFLNSASVIYRSISEFEKPSWCENAASLTEIAICGDAVLSKIDIDIARLFNSLGARDSIRLLARERLLLRNACGGNPACILEVTEETLRIFSTAASEFALELQTEKYQVSCWLTSPTAHVTNVNEYVNLRRQPDFSARVIRQVPLGEQVRPLRFDNLSVIGQERARQTCINACQAFGANREDRTARDRAQQCIDDNMLWYEITDARGNRGWVSRKFLEEVE